MVCFPRQARMTGERRQANLQTTERIPGFLVVNKDRSGPIYVCFSQSLLNQWMKNVLKTCMRGMLKATESKPLTSYLIFLFYFSSLFSLLLGFWLPSSSVLSCLCACSSFRPSSIWLILIYPSSSNVPVYLLHNPSLCSKAILSIIPLWHLTLALTILLAK